MLIYRRRKELANRTRRANCCERLRRPQFSDRPGKSFPTAEPTQSVSLGTFNKFSEFSEAPLSTAVAPAEASDNSKTADVHSWWDIRGRHLAVDTAEREVGSSWGGAFHLNAIHAPTMSIYAFRGNPLLGLKRSINAHHLPHVVVKVVSLAMPGRQSSYIQLYLHI